MWEKAEFGLVAKPRGLVKQCSTRALILCPWRQRSCEVGMVPQPLPQCFSTSSNDMTNSSAQFSCQELTLLQTEEPWQHLLSRKGNCWLNCSRPGEMLKTCNAPRWQAGIIRTQVFRLPCKFPTELQSGFMSSSGLTFLENSQPLCPPLSHPKTHLCSKAGDGGSRMARYPSDGDPWLPYPYNSSLHSHWCLTGLRHLALVYKLCGRSIAKDQLGCGCWPSRPIHPLTMEQNPHVNRSEGTKSTAQGEAACTRVALPERAPTSYFVFSLFFSTQLTTLFTARCPRHATNTEILMSSSALLWNSSFSYLSASQTFKNSFAQDFVLWRGLWRLNRSISFRYPVRDTWSLFWFSWFVFFFFSPLAFFQQSYYKDGLYVQSKVPTDFSCSATAQP